MTKGIWIVFKHVPCHILQARLWPLSRRRCWPGRAAWGRMSPKCWLWSRMAGRRMRSRRQLWSSSSQVSTGIHLTPRDCPHLFYSFKHSEMLAKDQNYGFYFIVSLWLYPPPHPSNVSLHLVMEQLDNCSATTWCILCVRHACLRVCPP